MTQCERLSDRIPDVALGRSVWTVEEQAHLENCADCRAEWDLVGAAGRLGTTLPPLSSPEVMTAALAGRLAGERAAVKARRRSWLAVGLAAAAVTIIAVRIPRPPAAPPAPTAPVDSTRIWTRVIGPASLGSPSVASTPAIQLPELDGLPDAELESILGSLDESSAVPSLDGTGFDQPDDHQLEQALEAWEG
jgi:anti-sigma factor RsiW